MQIAFFLRKVCRKAGTNNANFYHWHKGHSGTIPADYAMKSMQKKQAT